MYFQNKSKALIPGKGEPTPLRFMNLSTVYTTFLEYFTIQTGLLGIKGHVSTFIRFVIWDGCGKVCK